MSRYLIGFDRFIALDWANYAKEISSHSDSETVKKAQLKEWLSLRVSGKDAARKTANVLTRLWLDENPTTTYFKNEVHRIRLDTKKSDYILFHWGMSLLVFPFFYDTCNQIGRLFTLQTKISRRDIQIRMGEKYSNQGSVPRSVDRILQSLVDWGVLEKLSFQELGIKVYETPDVMVKKWLLEAVVFSSPQKRIPVAGFYKLPALFPFEYNGDVRQILGTSTKLGVERDGNNSEYIVWRKT